MIPDRKIDAERELTDPPLEVDSGNERIAPDVLKEGNTPELPGPSEDGGPPNDGFEAWLQVVGAFFLFMNSWVSIAIHITLSV
jgi:hypothetical protein